MKWLGADPVAMEDHPDKWTWFYRAQAGIRAENFVAAQQNKPKSKAGR